MTALPETSTLFALLRSQEFGSRRECQAMLRSGGVEWAHEPEDPDVEPQDFDWREERDPDAKLETAGLWIRYNGLALPVLPELYLAFHKPAGVECSRTPDAHESVFAFFPEPFLRRGLQPVGRLDADTTGLLLLTTDGTFNHTATSPRHKLPKTYRVVFRHALTDAQAAQLETGVLLRDDPDPTLPATVVRHDARTIDLGITEGRYHQIKRMGGAVGNRVESIHRIAIGPLGLEDLPEGEWRFLTEEEVRAVGSN